MAMFATGNPGWDQGLNSLAGALFPDPSKQAQAGYYGAESAMALTKNYQLRDQMAETRRLQDLMATQGPIVGPASPPGPQMPGPQPNIPYTPPAPVPLASPQVPGQPPPLATTVAPGPTPAASPNNMGGPIPPIPGNPATPPFAATPGGPGPAPAPPAPPSAPNPAAAPAPGVGTDGRPTPPDTRPAPAGGGGTPQAAPAQANGQPVQPQINLPYLMVTAARAGFDPNVVKLLGTSWINEQMRLGRMDAATAARFLSGAGDPTMLQGQNQLAQTNLQGQWNVANTREQGAQQRLLENMKPVQVDDPEHPGHPLLLPPGTVTAPGAHYNAPNVALDTAMMQPVTVITPDGRRLPPMTMRDYLKNPSIGVIDTTLGQTPLAVRPSGAEPTAPPVYQSPTQATITGASPASETNNVLAVKNDGSGEVVNVTEAQLRSDPSIHRWDQQVDGEFGQVLGQGGRTIYVLKRKMAGMTPAPQTTEQATAQTIPRVTSAIEGGNARGAASILDAYQTAQLAAQPKQQITPDQRARMTLESNQHLQSLYPVPSGTHFNTFTGPVTPDAETLAYHDSLTRQLVTGQYRNDPAAAELRAWDIMREKGQLSDPATHRYIGTSLTGEHPDVTGGANPALVIHLNKANIPHDANGNIIWPGGGPRTQPTLSDTVVSGAAGATGDGVSAPGGAQAAPAPGATRPPNAIGVAPPGAAEGAIVESPAGRGRVQGGFVVPLMGNNQPGSGANTVAPAIQPQPQPVAPTPAAPGLTLSDIISGAGRVISAPARAVARRQQSSPRSAQLPQSTNERFLQ